MKEKAFLKAMIEENLVEKQKLYETVLKTETKKGKGRMTIKQKFAMVPLCACLVVVVGLNVSPAFAESLGKVPVLGAVAKLVTVREYHEESVSSAIEVKIPKLEGVGNTEVEKQINQTILAQITELAETAKGEAEDFRKEFLAMGNTEAAFQKFLVHFDYEIKYSREKEISFVITKEISGNEIAADKTYYMYNLNLETGKAITLEEKLGSDYKEKINQQIDQQIRTLAKDHANLLSYYEEFYVTKGAEDDIENRNFYLNQEGNVVLVFYPYEIAPEAMGTMEFIIQPS